MDTQQCPHCDHALSDAEPACPQCGRPASTTPDAWPEKNRMLTVLLAAFLGWAGVHRFYVGKPLSGVLYLAFFWTLFPAFFAVREAIGCLVAPEERERAYGVRFVD